MTEQSEMPEVWYRAKIRFTIAMITMCALVALDEPNEDIRARFAESTIAMAEQLKILIVKYEEIKKK